MIMVALRAIASSAERLESVRKIVLDQPPVQVEGISAAHAEQLLTMTAAITADVINRRVPGTPAAGTGPSVVTEHGCPQPRAVTTAAFPDSSGVQGLPSARPYALTLWPGLVMLPLAFLYGIQVLRPVLPGTPPGGLRIGGVLLSLLSQDGFAIFLVVTAGTFACRCLGIGHEYLPLMRHKNSCPVYTQGGPG